MFENFSKAARKQLGLGQRVVASLSREFALAVCPSDNLQDFHRCLAEAQDFQHCAVTMMKDKNKEIHDLCRYIDFAKESFSYSELMDYFASDDRDWDSISCDIGGETPILLSHHQHYPKTHYLCRTSQRFRESFNRLPQVVQITLDQGLRWYGREFLRGVRQTSWALYLEKSEPGEKLLGH